MTQDLSDQPSKADVLQQPGKRKKMHADGKQEPAERKKAKVSKNKFTQPLASSGNELFAEAALERCEASTQGQGGNIHTDDILSKYKFLTVTKSTSPSKPESTVTGPVKKKGGSKAREVLKKVKAKKKNISGTVLEKGEDGLMKKTDEAISSRNQVQALTVKEQLESATTPVNYEKRNNMDQLRNFSEEENTVMSTANILNKYKFLTDVALPRKDGVEEVTMEEITEEDLLGEAAGSDLVKETLEKEGREEVAKVGKKSSNTAAMRKEIIKERVKCEQCEKTFATPTGLKQHITVHTNEKPYRCKECPDKFRNFNMLSGHKKKTHPKSLPDHIGMAPSTLV